MRKLSQRGPLGLKPLLASSGLVPVRFPQGSCNSLVPVHNPFHQPQVFTSYEETNSPIQTAALGWQRLSWLQEMEALLVSDPTLRCHRSQNTSSPSKALHLRLGFRCCFCLWRLSGNPNKPTTSSPSQPAKPFSNTGVIRQCQM